MANGETGSSNKSELVQNLFTVVKTVATAAAIIIYSAEKIHNFSFGLTQNIQGSNISCPKIGTCNVIQVNKDQGQGAQH